MPSLHPVPMLSPFSLQSRRRRVKPYSEMTWEEKARWEQEEARKAVKALTERATHLPMDKLGRVKKGVRVQDYRPGAPRNTTEVGAWDVGVPCGAVVWSWRACSEMTRCG